MNRLLLLVAGGGFLLFGALILVRPIATFAGIDLAFPDSPLGRIELRAFYGGLELGLGALLVAAAFKAAYERAGLWLSVGSYGAIGSARAIGIALEGGVTNGFLIGALAFELGIGGLALWRALTSHD